MPDYNPEEIELFEKLDTPSKIQDYLDSIAYDPVIGTSSPRYAIKEKKANCFEGAMIAAAALEYHGQKPLVVDMEAKNDDDHIICVYKNENYWGSIAKSNTTVLRYREPIYRNIRELVMSYFEFYITLDGTKSLRKYSLPVNLSKYNGWQTTNKDLAKLSDILAKSKHYPLLTRSQIKNLKKADEKLIAATLIGADPKGLYKPK